MAEPAARPLADLEGIVVVALEHAVAAPMASCKLADAGARVIKVERPGGDFARYYDDTAKGESAYFVWLNRGKQSICLDLRENADRAILSNMLKKADIFIQNLAPGAVDRLGFGYKAISEQNPGLIYCSISGYGADDTSGKKAYDLLIQGEAGLTAITRNANGMARIGISLCDISTGATAYSLILQALIGRAKTGKGRLIDVSLYHTASDWMNVPFIQFYHGGKTPKPGGVEHPSIAPYGKFTCADGKALIISIQNEREWQRLCRDVFGDAGLAEDDRFCSNINRIKNREMVDGICAEYFASLEFAEAAKILTAHQIAFGQVSELGDIAKHPATRMMTVETPSGAVELIAPPMPGFGPGFGPGFRPESGLSPDFGKVPALDEHGKALRAEFG